MAVLSLLMVLWINGTTAPWVVELSPRKIGGALLTILGLILVYVRSRKQ